MNKYKNKWIIIVAIMVIVIGIIIYSNKDDITNLISTNTKYVYDSNSYYNINNNTCKKKINNPYILGAYYYNDTVSNLEEGYCVDGTENTCKFNTCIGNKDHGTCEAGTIILYRVNEDEVYYFNVLHDDGETMTLQSVDDTIQTSWGTSLTDGPIKVLAAITEATKDWSNVNDLTYTLGETIFLKYPNYSWNDNPYTYCSSYNSCTSNAYTLSSDLTKNVKARIISVQEATDLGCTSNKLSCPNYLSTKGILLWTLQLSKSNAYIIHHDRYILGSGSYNITSSSVNTAKSYAKAVVEINK
jgi:hypothetical protein